MKALFHLLTLAGPQHPATVAMIVLRLLESAVASLPLAIVLATAASIIDPAVTPLPPPATLPGAVLPCCILFAAYGLQWGVSHAAGHYGYLVGYRLSATLRCRLVEHLRTLPALFFQDRDGGDLTSAILNDVTRIEVFPGIVLPRLAQAIILPLIGLLAGSLVDWRLALPLVMAMILMPFALAAGAALQRGEADKLLVAGTRLNSRLLEFIQAMPVLKAFGLTLDHLHGCRSAIREARDRSKSLTGRYVLAAILVPLLVAAAGLATVGQAFLSMQSGAIPPIHFLLFLFLTLRLFSPMIELVEFSAIIQQMALSAERLVAILAAPRQAAPVGGEIPADNSVRFDDVSVVHEDGTRALDRISFTAPAGRITALVGPTGSGKTTAARLITRYLDPTSGRIEIGGVDSRRMTPDVLADLVGVIPQTITLFTMSVRDNIRLAKPSATDCEVEAAARKARCHDLILSLPRRYDTILENGGATLSGGERQRVGLARLFLQDSPIVVLDEATSSLDVENERLVQQAMSELVRGRTVIIIAHRLWTIRHADQIVVLHEGRVEQTGAHEELSTQDGPYRQLWQALDAAPGWRRCDNNNHLHIIQGE